MTGPQFAEEAQAALEARAAVRRARVDRGELTPESGMGSMQEWRLDLGGYQLYLAPLTGEWLYLDPAHEAIEPTGYRSGDVTFGVLDGMLGVRLRHRPAPAPALTAPMPFASPVGLLSPPPLLGAAAPTRAGPPVANPPPPAPRPGRSRSILRLLALVPMLISIATTGVGIYQLVHTGHPSMVSAASAGPAAPSSPPTSPAIAASSTTATPSTADPSSATATTPSTTHTPSTTAAASTTTLPSTTAPAAKTVRCTNRTVGYSVAYPVGWSVTAGPDGTCQYFNPTPFHVPQDTEVAVAIVIYEMPDDFATATAQFTQPGLLSILRQEPATVAGHRALRILYRDQGETGTTGAKNYEILIDHNHHTLALAAHAPFSANFTTTQHVLKTMAASLTL